MRIVFSRPFAGRQIVDTFMKTLPVLGIYNGLWQVKETTGEIKYSLTTGFPVQVEVQIGAAADLQEREREDEDRLGPPKPAYTKIDRTVRLLPLNPTEIYSEVKIKVGDIPFEAEGMYVNDYLFHRLQTAISRFLENLHSERPSIAA